MASSRVPDSQLDSELAAMREHIESLERRRSVLSSTLLSSQHTLTRIQRANAKSNSASSPAAAALAIAEKQQRHNLENLHRACAGVTAFRIKDPDPYAVDDGKVLGVRIEVSVKGQFMAPYYLLLNRPSPESDDLRIHKHTIPPSIPLQALAAKYLPQNPMSGNGSSADLNSGQDLHRLVRELRNELVSHHSRLDVVTKLRKDAELPEDVDEGSERKSRGKGGITDVRALDVGATEIEICWRDGSKARVLVSKRGVIEKAVARDSDGAGRKRAVERRIMGGDCRVEGVISRLTSAQDAQ